MARLSLFLPPFAGDYSGACSTLFGMDCLVVIVDASCCTRNYVEYDEPRWARRRKSTFSAQLRTLEAVMGDDARIVGQAADMARELRPACVALVGSPVPAVTGMDLAGMARELEDACGLPCLGLDATGFETYDAGVSLTLEALVRRFAGEAGGRRPERGADGPLRLNVLGLSPHDFADEADLRAPRAWLEAAGAQLAFCPDGRFEPADVAAAADADASVVVSWAGLAAARWLRERRGVPYVVGRLLCAAGARELVARLRAGCMRPLWESADEGAACPGETPIGDGQAPGRLLIVGEQVAANCLRAHARRARPGLDVRVASFFGMDRTLAEPGDVRLADERALASLATEVPGTCWAGDPLLARIPQLAGLAHVGLPHEAVSSTLYEDARAALSGEGMLGALTEFLATRPRG